MFFQALALNPGWCSSKILSSTRRMGLIASKYLRRSDVASGAPYPTQSCFWWVWAVFVGWFGALFHSCDTEMQKEKGEANFQTLHCRIEMPRKVNVMGIMCLNEWWCIANYIYIYGITVTVFGVDISPSKILTLQSFTLQCLSSKNYDWQRERVPELWPCRVKFCNTTEIIENMSLDMER